jgi:hypothetical protein
MIVRIALSTCTNYQTGERDQSAVACVFQQRCITLVVILEINRQGAGEKYHGQSCYDRDNATDAIQYLFAAPTYHYVSVYMRIPYYQLLSEQVMIYLILQ